MSEHDSGRAETDRAFDRLYRRHRLDVYRAAMRRTNDHHEAEDVTQAAFLDAYRAVLRGTEPELPRAWLLAIAENVRRRRFAASLRRPRQTPLADDVVPARSQHRGETAEIFAALAALPPNQRAAFVLREVGGLSYLEIASRLDVSVPSVQMLLFRARQSLRAHLAPPDRPLSWLFVPHWLAGLANRFETASVGVRSAGAVGAAVVVAAGVSGASADAEPRVAVASEPPRVLSRAAPQRVAPVPARRSRTMLAPSGDPSIAPAPVAPPASAVSPASLVVIAAPAAPSTVRPPTVSGDGERSAIALVPAPPSLGILELPVPVPVPPPVSVPVVEPPSVEGAELPALDLPVVPELPVEVGGTPPLLPGS